MSHDNWDIESSGGGGCNGGGKLSSIWGRSMNSPTGVVVVVRKASLARYDSSTASKISNVHVWVEANHESSEIYISRSFKVMISITFVSITRCFTP